MELATYIEANREKLEEAPFGLYAVVPPHAEFSAIKPGIIYCLKQRIDAAGNEAVNPLQPYFLVYIRDDGEVRYNFTAPKQILKFSAPSARARPSRTPSCASYSMKRPHTART